MNSIVRRRRRRLQFVLLLPSLVFISDSVNSNHLLNNKFFERNHL